MNTYELISVVAAVIAVVFSAVALFFNGIQTKRATQAQTLNQQLMRGDAVMHFTSRFFDLMKNGEPVKRFQDADWAYQFWSLHATEFYFFQHSVLPVFMYSLWMIDLAKLYCGAEGEKARSSHVQYLNTYSI